MKKILTLVLLLAVFSAKAQYTTTKLGGFVIIYDASLPHTISIHPDSSRFSITDPKNKVRMDLVVNSKNEPAKLDTVMIYPKTFKNRGKGMFATFSGKYSGQVFGKEGTSTEVNFMVGDMAVMTERY